MAPTSDIESAPEAFREAPAFLTTSQRQFAWLPAHDRETNGGGEGFSGENLFILPNPWADPRRHILRRLLRRAHGCLYGRNGRKAAGPRGLRPAARRAAAEAASLLCPNDRLGP